jgi:hypothetical protein
MLRYAVLLFLGLAGLALITRRPGTRRVLWVLAGLVILYAVLKLTGVIEALAPGRLGVS